MNLKALILYIIAVIFSNPTIQGDINNTTSNAQCITTRSVSQWKNPSSSHPKQSIAVWAHNTCHQRVTFEIDITKKSTGWDNGRSMFKSKFTLSGREKKLILGKERVWGSPMGFDYNIRQISK